MQSDTKLIRGLKGLGLNEKEARVYLAGLKSGATSIMQIAHKGGGINRTTAYSIIESLKNKGLFFEEEDGFKKQYRSAAPAEIRRVLDMQREEFEHIADDLSSLHAHKTDQTAIKMYSGRAAIRTLYDNVLRELKSRDEYLAISDTQAWQQSDPVFFKAFIQKRTRQGVHTKLLLQDTPAAHDAIRSKLNSNEEVRILPKNMFEANMIITPRMVLIHEFVGKPTALLIRNPRILSLHRQLFYLIWNSVADK